MRGAVAKILERHCPPPHQASAFPNAPLHRHPLTSNLNNGPTEATGGGGDGPEESPLPHRIAAAAHDHMTVTETTAAATTEGQPHPNVEQPCTSAASAAAVIVEVATLHNEDGHGGVADDDCTTISADFLIVEAESIRRFISKLVVFEKANQRQKQPKPSQKN